MVWKARPQKINDNVNDKQMSSSVFGYFYFSKPNISHIQLAFSVASIIT